MPASTAAPCVRLLWDTEFWGFLVARVQGSLLSQDLLERIDAWCQAERVRCLYLLATPDDFETTRLAEAHGFRLVDVRLTFARAVPSEAITNDAPIRIRAAVEGDIASLRRIASTAYRDTRFHVDPHFPPERADELYATWIEKSCHGYANAVLVAEDATARVAGYVSCHLDGSAGTIGLVGVESAARGQGVAQHLLAAALDWFREHGASTVSIATQVRNIAAQRSYARAGFLMAEAGLWFHRWHDAAGRPAD